MPAPTRSTPVPVGRMLRSLAAAAERPRPGQFIVTAWSESCACGGSLFGHEEEPCTPDCTGYHPVRGRYVFGSGGGPQAAGQPGDSHGPTQATWYD
ncbi:MULTISPECIES: hypothetical protein [Streptomyces]|uniref:Uncharacterized protein n=1 Tax=Streptomyces luteosporeus TaxID=173856 RepID=A0ABN3TYB8_9ACTN